MTNKQLRVLLCEDEENLGNLLCEILEQNGYIVDHFTNGQQGWEAFMNENYDLCLLDIMMPLKDGMSLAKDIRKVDETVPIIFLTAMGMRENVLEGFHAGADDYITKPFSMEELQLRIEAILRRTGTLSREDRTPQEEFVVGKYIFNSTDQTLTHEDGSVQRMTTKETELLSLLCQFANRTLERPYALSVIWGIVDQGPADSEQTFSQRSMDVYITKLRRMLAADPEIEIKNVHGKGYKLVLPISQRQAH